MHVTGSGLNFTVATDCSTNFQEDCRLQHMFILLKHANHKGLLTSTNNGVKTSEVAVTDSRCMGDEILY